MMRDNFLAFQRTLEFSKWYILQGYATKKKTAKGFKILPSSLEEKIYDLLFMTFCCLRV